MNSITQVVSSTSRTWIAGPGGEVSLWAPPKPALRLTPDQQHAAMRLALAHVFRVLTENGFQDNGVEQSSCAIGLTFLGLDFDITIREPARIAYVTSTPGDTMKRREISKDRFGNPVFEVGGGVKFASDEISSAYVVQVVGSRISSDNPLYIECPLDDPDPVGCVLKNVLTLIANIVKDKNLLNQASSSAQSMLSKRLPPRLASGIQDAISVMNSL